MPPLDARTVDHCAESRIFVQHLTLENAAVLEREVEDVALRRVGHRVEADDGCRSLEALHAVTHTPQVSMTTMQAADAAQRLALRQ